MMCLHEGFKEQPWVSALSFCCGFCKLNSGHQACMAITLTHWATGQSFTVLRNPSKKNKQKTLGIKVFPCDLNIFRCWDLDNHSLVYIGQALCLWAILWARRLECQVKNYFQGNEGRLLVAELWSLLCVVMTGCCVALELGKRTTNH